MPKHFFYINQIPFLEIDFSNVLNDYLDLIYAALIMKFK